MARLLALLLLAAAGLAGATVHPLVSVAADPAGLAATTAAAADDDAAALLPHLHHGRHRRRRRAPSWRSCNTEQQLVMCGDVPPTAIADRYECCRLHRPVELPAAAAEAAAAADAEQLAVAAQTPRSDLAAGGELAAPPPYACAPLAAAQLPRFTRSGNTTSATVVSVSVPALNRTTIQRIKAEALAALPAATRADINRTVALARAGVNTAAGFSHPGGVGGAAELALLRSRLAAGAPVQVAARDSLLLGTGVPPKSRPVANSTASWAPPTDCKPAAYQGPFAVAKVQIKYSGINNDGVSCSTAYPRLAPRDICQHVSFVELDGQMAYKLAVAFHVTGDNAYADKLFAIADSWATINKEWGLRWLNSPLEASWGIAAMARALELVRGKAPSGLIPRFVAWVNAVPILDMEHFVTNLTKGMWGNWHSSILEAWMALGVLADDRARYNKGVALFKATVDDYLKWGKGSFTQGRLLGECTETLRDLYHSQFGLGGLLQAAELAWSQDDDLYSYGGHALAAAMELHARITLSVQGTSRDAGVLPPGYRFFEQMPKPPCAGCSWAFNITAQRWQAFYANGTLQGSLADGFKYALGVGFLPTAWEVGYNHYVGRLGLQLPESAALLARSWPEWQEFHWGLGTLTHSQTAQALWRPGVKNSTLCARATPG